MKRGKQIDKQAGRERESQTNEANEQSKNAGGRIITHTNKQGYANIQLILVTGNYLFFRVT